MFKKFSFEMQIIVQYPYEGITLPIALENYGLQKDEDIIFHIFYWSL
jgi:hypothetical protein